MADDRVPSGVPAAPSSDGLAESAELPSSDGFLIDDAAERAPDGEQLFRQAVKPKASRTQPAPAALGHGADPAGNALMFRILGGVAVIIAPFIALSTRSPGGIIAAAALVLGGLFVFFYLGSDERLRRDQVVDRWDILIGGAQGRRDEVMTDTVARIKANNLPQIRHVQRGLATRLTRAEKRPFLVVSHDGNDRLRPYRVHVNVRDYGTSLQANWYLSYHRGFFEKLKPNPLVALDLFDEQDLRAYVTTVHHCLLDAVVDLMVALGKDASKIERNSRGFLGLS